ncbi:MAG TPA: S8 family serine peptidase [Pyrinomonadaceae bacterium]|jgi:hypothetical protein
MQVSPFARRLARAASARRFTLLLSLLAVAALAPFATHGAQDAPAPRSAAKSRGKVADFVPGHVLVRFRSEAAARRVESAPGTVRGTTLLRPPHGAVLDGTGYEQIEARVERFEGSDLVRGLRLAYVEPGDTLAAIEAFKSMPDVLYAEPDYVRHLANTPNDQRFPEMFGLKKINAEGAWNTTTGGGAGVVVGVVDEGVDITHPDLAANIWTNPGEIAGNGVDDDGNGKIDDVNGWDFTACTNPNPNLTPGCGNNSVFDGAGGAPYVPGDPASDQTDAHGTHVAGTIGAVGNNSLGVVGVNWNVKIMPLKFIGASTGETSNAIRAEAYAKAMRDKWVATNGAQGANVRVLNNSYGGSGSSQAELDSIRAVGDSGILFVAAAGNRSLSNDFAPSFPSNYDAANLIAVAASDSADNLSSFSSFGARLVSVAAPGSGILSTTPDSTYDFFQGTSMAAPHVAGLAALVCALDPQMDVSRLRSLVAYNGDLMPAAAGKLYTQRRINAFNSVQAALENDPRAPAAPANFRVASQSGRIVVLNFNAPGDDANTGNAALYEVSFISAADGATFVLKTAIPKPPGSAESLTVAVPWRQTAGTLRLRALDNVGKESQASAPVSVPLLAADPYLAPSLAAAQPLSTGGTRLALNGDDRYLHLSTLPFAFPFYGLSQTSAVVSTNGALYFEPSPPVRSDGDANDVPSSVEGLQGFQMIAGLWDDLMIDTTRRADSGVFLVQPDPDRAIFRWQGVPCNFDDNTEKCKGGLPVNFEIELRKDGTIITRYGDNAPLFPVVGISGGQPSAYLVGSHTSPDTPINLTNAATVVFTPRTAATPAPSLQFSAAAYSFPESAGAAVLTVTRTGDTSAAVGVDVRTVDDAAIVPCADTSGSVAFARCDYATTVQTLTFAAGETTKTVNVPLVNDAHVEPNETVQIALSNATGGAALAAPSTAVLTITSDDAPGAINPILTTDFFVRQQYLDFFGREPDADGFAAWKATLGGCPDPFNTIPSSPSANCDRVSVSSKFFLSKEFALKGRFVFNFYRVAFNRLPHYSEIIPDMASLTAVDDAGFFARKGQFTNAFVARQEFKSTYDALTNTQFADALMSRYGLQQITTPDPLNPDGSTKVTLTRSDMLARLNLGTLTRAQAVRAMADSDEVSAAEANSSFVAMQYFGYLRRDPEEGGYNDWLRTINANPADIRSMVNGFMNSTEYRLRFGGQ